ncbi:MAG: hypothetical protein RBU30_25730, partial [Polyangia bacterium]|nr:hypothetical protein [Polyangia bacterium]
MSQRIPSDESPETPAGASATRGERTLELAVLYGHSPQRVLHLEPPTSGRPRFFSLLMFALGFALLVAGASSFGYQLLRVHRETLHRAKVVEFVKERGLPEKYAPQVTTRPGAEAASAAAFAAGLFLFLFGGLRLREELRRPGFRVGEDPRADYSVPSAALPSSCFELVSADDEGYRVHLTTSMEGEATLPEGDRVALADLRKRGLATLDQGERSHAWLLPEDGRCRIELGATTFLLHATRTNSDLLPSPVSKRALAALGSPLALSTLGSATVLVAFLALLQWRPGTTDSLESDSVDSTRQRLVRELQASAPKEKVAPRPKAPREPARPVKVALHSKDRKTASQTPRPIDERISGPAQDAAGHSGPGASSSRHRGLNTGMVAVLRASSQQLANMFSRQAAMTQDAEDSLAAITGYTYGSGDPLAGLGDGGRGGHTPGAGGASPCGAFCSFGKEPFGGFP